MTTYERPYSRELANGEIVTGVETFELEGEPEKVYLAPDRLREGYHALREWSADAEAAHTDWPTYTQAQKDTALRETIRRLGLFFDRFADLLLVDKKAGL